MGFEPAMRVPSEIAHRRPDWRWKSVEILIESIGPKGPALVKLSFIIVEG